MYAAKPEAAAKAKKPKPVPAEVAEGEELAEDFEIDDEDAAAVEGDEDDFIEDTGDLGEDDMSDVVVEGEDDET